MEGMDGLLQGFWWVALISSLIFVIQMVLTFAGGDHSDGLQTDLDSTADHLDTPFQLFTLRNLINFMLGFGWTGIAFYNTVSSKTLLVLLAVIVGFAFVVLFFIIIRQILKLTEDNTFNIQELLNHTGTAYLLIPAKMEGLGKVQISLRGSTHELDAMTEGPAIPSGAVVMVQRIERNILIVRLLS